MKYDFTAIETKWQQQWASDGTFATPNPGEAGFDPAKPKFYVLDMFPYPSGVGLHVGHPLGYIATDIVARYKRMRGFNVLHPMGYDAFGLPAEQYAVEQGVHPRITTEKNIANMTRQLKRLGLSYDWDRCFATTDEGYYRWTQWIFLQLYNCWFDPTLNKARPIAELEQKLAAERYYVGLDDELAESLGGEGLSAVAGAPVGARKWHELSADERNDFLDNYRLAYMDEVPVNWCPALGTVLANEEVTNDGRSERGNHPVYKRPLRQWMLRITAYAQRLADDLDGVDWPESTKQMQRNWIGRSDGARVDFPLAYVGGGGSGGGGGGVADETITVFTTRPDTLFGATYMVLAPEHPLVEAVTTAEQYHAVSQYQKQAAAKTDVDRQAEAAAGQKTGVFTGAYALNPVNNQKIPIWIADYVMMGYGTGAIMAVPAHDGRDFEFARQFGLPIKPVVVPDEAFFRRLAPEAAKPAGRELTQELLNIYLCDPGQFREAFTGDGAGVNSANEEVSLNGLKTADAKQEITRWLKLRGLGEPSVQYKLRDWLFSRQRYWGEPFPILHAPASGGGVVALDESELPVLLPEMDNFQPSSSDDPGAPPLPPLSRASEAWKYLMRPAGGGVAGPRKSGGPGAGNPGVRFTREFNTMPQWAGSCWYYLRFLDPHNAERFVGKEAERYWMGGRKSQVTSHKSKSDSKPGDLGLSTCDSPAGGVDLYVGGVEHAVLHLLYARFWHKVLFDLGYVSTPEPFGRLFNQGYIQAYCYRDARGIAVPAADVVNQEGKPAGEVQSEPGQRYFYKGEPVTQEYGKMGKGLKNAVAPDDMCTQYGADSLRLYEMYLGPLDQSKPWRTQDIVGVHRFLQRVWRLLVDETTGTLKVSDSPAPDDLRRLLHKTIKRVTEAMESMSFNVAIAALIEMNNELVKRYPAEEATDARTEPESRQVGTSPTQPRTPNPEPSPRQNPGVPREIATALILCLGPLAPHLAEELWQKLGHAKSLAYAPWPRYDPALLVEDQIEYPVQVNGKLRGRITVPADADDKTIEAAAIAEEKVKAALAGKPAKKIIIIKGRLVNVVVG